jgi:hypothetical protein
MKPYGASDVCRNGLCGRKMCRLPAFVGDVRERAWTCRWPQCVVCQINVFAGRRTHGPCVPTFRGCSRVFADAHGPTFFVACSHGLSKNNAIFVGTSHKFDVLLFGTSDDVSLWHLTMYLLIIFKNCKNGNKFTTKTGAV